MKNINFAITFWGVRGSCPSLSPDTLSYGGNTSCVHVQIRERHIILDAGTGILQLGNYLAKTNDRVSADIFISHSHWDHIQGIPYFSPIYEEGNHFIFYGESKKEISFSDVIKGVMSYPYFPKSWESLKSTLDFKEISSNQCINLGDDILVHTLKLTHPGGCLAYRIDFQGKSCCYVTDIEYKDPDPELYTFIKHADIVIFDAQFTNEEYLGNSSNSSKIGWGHSTWQKASQLAKEANVKKLFLFHHDINRSDSEIQDMEKMAQNVYKDVFAAREGLRITI